MMLFVHSDNQAWAKKKTGLALYWRKMFDDVNILKRVLVTIMNYSDLYEGRLTKSRITSSRVGLFITLRFGIVHKPIRVLDAARKHRFIFNSTYPGGRL
jgi:hypothetical protein